MYLYPANVKRQELLKSDTAERLGIENVPKSTYIEANLQLTAFTLQTIRDTASRLLGKDASIIITSGLRSDTLNKAVGGVSGSAHGLGLAADFKIVGMSIPQVILMIHDHLPALAFHKVIDEFGRWVHLTVASPTGETKREYLTARTVNGRTVYSAINFSNGDYHG